MIYQLYSFVPNLMPSFPLITSASTFYMISDLTFASCKHWSVRNSYQHHSFHWIPEVPEPFSWNARSAYFWKFTLLFHQKVDSSYFKDSMTFFIFFSYGMKAILEKWLSFLIWAYQSPTYTFWKTLCCLITHRESMTNDGLMCWLYVHSFLLIFLPV